jgi:regulator of protease activity HflC (stomatin/prohibitin superfamily)
MRNTDVDNSFLSVFRLVETNNILYFIGPGLFFILPCIDTYSKVDLRTVTFDVPPQEILTKDSVTVAVDAVVYFRIFNAVISITNVEDAAKSTKLLAATTLRNVKMFLTSLETLCIRLFLGVRYENTS